MVPSVRLAFANQPTMPQLSSAGSMNVCTLAQTQLPTELLVAAARKMDHDSCLHQQGGWRSLPAEGSLTLVGTG
jgi:hypothetical protein